MNDVLGQLHELAAALSSLIVCVVLHLSAPLVVPKSIGCINPFAALAKVHVISFAYSNFSLSELRCSGFFSIFSVLFLHRFFANEKMT
ncbi:MAG: hypothetical protein JST44_20705 [Cyanobacteria bacterium SZAS LIN-5]|nr:hypothetical protein [Cyanobacteria bacterium SZAS LIN-5]